MAAQRSRFMELGDILRERVAEIDQYLSSQGQPAPSFSKDAPPDHPLPPSLLRSRDEILEACSELQALAEGPFMHLTRLTSPAMNVLMSIQAIYRFNIARNVAVDEEVSFKELATRCNIDEHDLSRLMRTAIANHIFHEPRKGFVIHSAISKYLAEVPLLHSWIGLVCEEMWPLQHLVVEAIQKWPGSQEQQHTAYGLANPDGKSYFEALGEDPTRAQRFSDGMKYLQSAPAFALTHLFTDLGWDTTGVPSMMVDIGGSRGSVAVELLRKYPTLRCEVQDLAETISQANVPDDLQDRLEFRAHNFFTEQVRRNADVYFMRSILHDWPDKYAVQILRNIIPALKHGSKIIINEVCLPEPNTLPFYHAQLLRGYDLAMKMNFNSKERDADEWAALLKAADPRLRLGRITCSPGSILSVIEAVWEENTL
ncbi:S-adenosyl-L-methionine-dependent methyltransferase [Hypoxylon sp. FL1857]|nr:S-adenosyl-L-methionine-dependent methyltransferase [Hypoxylon sp. FL1857]